MGSLIYFEETELRLGLPGGDGRGDGEAVKKRGFTETVDLKLNLVTDSDEGNKTTEKNVALSSAGKDLPKPPPAKAQVVGWPPVKSLRRNIIGPKKSKLEETEKGAAISGGSCSVGAAAAFIKVSMDGAPYLRKVDLKMYGSYQELSDALSNMFGSFTTGNCGPQKMRDYMNESKLIDVLNGSDYVPTYEDKDGDWMLIGDVPWDMFVDSCKRLRIMKGQRQSDLHQEPWRSARTETEPAVIVVLECFKNRKMVENL